MEETTKDNKYTVTQLNFIEFVLKELFNLKGTGLSYSLNKNLIALAKIRDSFQEQLTKMDYKFGVKRDDVLVMYEMEPFGNNGRFIHKVDPEGKLIESLDKKGPIGSAIDPKYREEYEEAYALLHQELHEINFHKIPEKKIEELCEQNIIDGINLSILFGTVIE